MKQNISRQRVYAALLGLGACILLFRTALMTAQGYLGILLPWVAALLVIELALDLGCLIGSIRWCVAGNEERARFPLRLGAAATILHAVRVLIYALGRTALLLDFDVRPDRRTGIIGQGGWFWVWFASILSILGLIGVLVIWLLRRRALRARRRIARDGLASRIPLHN
jgi:hypothetical protein